MIAAVAPPLLAFATAVLAVHADCYMVVRKTLRWVPRQVWLSGGILLMAVFAGALAAAAFERTVAAAGSHAALDTVLSLDIASPYLRAAYVGALVLVLIRSKFFDVKGAPFGLEWLYTEARLRAVDTALQRWQNWKLRFLLDNEAAAFAERDYFDRLADALQIAISLGGLDEKTKANLENAIRNRPPGPKSPANVAWSVYYRSLTRLALDTSGTVPFKAFDTIRFPR